jgi:hypothetical protein
MPALRAFFRHLRHTSHPRLSYTCRLLPAVWSRGTRPGGDWVGWHRRRGRRRARRLCHRRGAGGARRRRPAGPDRAPRRCRAPAALYRIAAQRQGFGRVRILALQIVYAKVTRTKISSMQRTYTGEPAITINSSLHSRRVYTHTRQLQRWPVQDLLLGGLRLAAGLLSGG